ncbi:DUF3775 domain-containing protein [Marinobacter salicampi]|uniref:DUF3775 domain-containing protein n=1 Tax=Marinobacter salicampi TaxID=435907 RepID=UPI00140D87F5|nr:DUF3775 domain-containing protein [Marinobacter salicampi]
MLQTNPETICRLIELAESYHVQEPATDLDSPDDPTEDWAQEMLVDTGDNSGLEEFKTVVEDLEPDQQQEVIALLWLGRGDYVLEEWEEIVKQAQEQWTPETADYLIQHPMLADHLREGLDLHGYSCQDSNFLNPG